MSVVGHIRAFWRGMRDERERLDRKARRERELFEQLAHIDELYREAEQRFHQGPPKLVEVEVLHMTGPRP